MKKKSILAMAMVFGLVGSTAFPVQAADTNCSDKQKEAKRYIVVGGKVSDSSEIKNVLMTLMISCKIVTGKIVRPLPYRIVIPLITIIISRIFRIREIQIIATGYGSTGQQSVR